MSNASKSYKDAFLESERMAKSYGVRRIESNPELARRFYEAQGKISAYENIFHGFGQSKLLQRLTEEIKEELKY
jgi:hypothetical protein